MFVDPMLPMLMFQSFKSWAENTKKRKNGYCILNDVKIQISELRPLPLDIKSYSHCCAMNVMHVVWVIVLEIPIKTVLH